MRTSFRLERRSVKNGAFRYVTYRVTGWLDGKRIRRQFKRRDEAEGEQQRLEIAAANRDQAVRAVPTRLTTIQVAEAEVAFARLGDASLSKAVGWFLETYRAPEQAVDMETASAAFLADRRFTFAPGSCAITQALSET